MAKRKVRRRRKPERKLDYTFEDLKGMSFEGLDKVFKDGVCPELRELEGDYVGHNLVFAKGVLHPATERVFEMLMWLWLRVWRGKTFEEGKGANIVSIPPFRLSILKFTMRKAFSIEDGSEILEFDYDLKENPPLVRRVRDEVKRVGENLYLGRAYMKLKDYVPFAYFVLVR